MEARDPATAPVDHRQYAVSGHEVRRCAVGCADEAGKVSIQPEPGLSERWEGIRRTGRQHVIVAPVTPKGRIGFPQFEWNVGEHRDTFARSHACVNASAEARFCFPCGGAPARRLRSSSKATAR
jgi:hypothetical protein